MNNYVKKKHCENLNVSIVSIKAIVLFSFIRQFREFEKLIKVFISIVRLEGLGKNICQHEIQMLICAEKRFLIQCKKSFSYSWMR